jgi:hypothetical protein
MTEVNRHISFYEKNGGKYIGEISLNNVDLNDLLTLITLQKYKNDNLLYDCYLLDKKMLEQISVLAIQSFILDLDKYEYYLEATTK